MGYSDDRSTTQAPLTIHAPTPIADGKPRMIEFGVADETAWQVGLSCGGRIKVYVERVD
jgi:xanthine/CO dehydrogenase XdhC/CoxF family maturation factor